MTELDNSMGLPTVVPGHSPRVPPLVIDEVKFIGVILLNFNAKFPILVNLVKRGNTPVNPAL